jgi:hypothetical protein
MAAVRRWLFLLLPSALLAVGTGQAAAQGGQVATAWAITLAAAKTSSLTLSITSGAVQSMPSFVDNAVNNFPTPVMIQTRWELNPGESIDLVIVGWFSTPAQALVAGGGSQIPSSRIKGKMTPGTAAQSWPAAFTAFTQNANSGVGTAGGSLSLLAASISGGAGSKTRTDQLDLQLDLTGAAALAPGTYTGTLNIQAVAQ